MVLKKLSYLVASCSLSIAFIGCGGGGSSSNSASTTTEIEVERGKVYDATVVDALGNIATQKEGENIYSFSSTPTYPLTVTGGWIDIDGDGSLTTEDISLDIELKSYSNTVTPITTYLANSDKSIRTSRLTTLQEITGKSEEDLLLVPSKSSKEVILMANSIYSIYKEYGESEINNKVSELSSKYDELKLSLNTYAEAEQSSMENIAKIVENEVINDLLIKGKVKKISSSEVIQFIGFSNIDGFSNDWLVDGMTFYPVFEKPEDIRDMREQPSWEFSNSSYNVENGNISMTTVFDNGEEYTTTFEFLSSTKDYISVKIWNDIYRFYKDSSTANTYLSSLTYDTVDLSGFESESTFVDFNGITMYVVHLDNSDVKYGEIETLEFGLQSVSGGDATSYRTASGNSIVFDEDYVNRIYPIASNSDYIEMSNNTKWFVSQSKAESYAKRLDSSNSNDDDNTDNSSSVAIPDLSNYSIITISNNITNSYNGASDIEEEAFSEYTSSNISCSDYGFSGSAMHEVSQVVQGTSDYVTVKMWASSDYTKQCYESDFSQTSYSGDYTLVHGTNY